MNQTLGQPTTEGDQPTLAHRVVRLVMVAYLSPVILLVLTIGLASMLVNRLSRPSVRPVVTGAHRAHGKARPFGVVHAVKREARQRV